MVMSKRLARSFFAVILAVAVLSSPAGAGFYVWQSGAWRTVANPYVWSSGSYRHIQNGYVWKSGAWRLFYTACTPVTHTFTSGSGNETVPSGAVSLVMSIVAAGGFGGGSQSTVDNYASGGGGGSGGASVRTISIASADWGQTLAYVVASSGGTNSSVSGTLNVGGISLSALHGQSGTSAPNQFTPGSGGAGGTASGGDTNYTGFDGGAGSADTTAQPGGSAGPSTLLGYGDGATGADAPGSPGSPKTGVVQFAYGC